MSGERGKAGKRRRWR